MITEELYQLYRKELVSWCRHMTGNYEGSEDLVQEAYMRAILHEDVLQELSAKQQRAWLYHTVKNLYVDKIRHVKKETIVEDVPEQDLEAGISEAEFSALEWQEVLQNLPDIEGLLFRLRYLDSYNSRQLGELFSLPPGTVRSKLSSARKHLREELERDFKRR